MAESVRQAVDLGPQVRSGAEPRAESAGNQLSLLQRAVGNAAIARLLGRSSAPSANSGLTIQRRIDDRPATNPVLRAGSTGPAVAHLQERLNEDGADPPLAVDEIFGPLTRGATLEFQRRHGLAPDGVVGIRTWGLIDELERRSINGPSQTVLDDVTPVSQEDHDEIETILHPSTPSGGGARPDMTGTGVGGAYETGMTTKLDALAAETLARPVATAAVNMDHANRVSAVAQEKVEAFFGSSITLASRRPTGDFHPGSSRMGLADASTRVNSEGDILGWTEYFMDNGSYEPGQFQNSQNYDNSRARPDRAEHDRVRDLWLSRGGRAKVDQMVRSWPAEAGSGTVFLQLRDPAYQDRVGMWSLFATLVHEFLHLVAHPNYSDTADVIAGGARDILVEGMDEHMAQQVWRGLRPTIAADSTLRTTIEGPFFHEPVNTADYDADSEIDHVVLDNHYDSMAEADQIAGRVGENNVRAAYFMGHVEAIGLGPSSASEAGLGGLASWTPGGGGNPDEYVVAAGGETVQQIRDRTGSTHIEDSSGSVWVDVTHSFASGDRLRVPGIRWHTAVAQDTRAQVAGQHGVTLDQLERANHLPAAPGNAAVTAGTLLLIPVHP